MLFTTNTLKAMTLAQHYHAGQVDKAGAPYLFHIMRVADSMKTEETAVVALLHDVFEDTQAQASILDDFPEEIRDAVTAITRHPKESYGDYIKRLALNEIAKNVKIADILEHLAPDRSGLLSDSLKERYLKALEVLVSSDEEKVCYRCKHCIIGPQWHPCCDRDTSGKTIDKTGCSDGFESRFITFPIVVTKIVPQNKSKSLYPCGQPVIVRPCEDNEEKKTYFGILLGELPTTPMCRYVKYSGILELYQDSNPAIFIPDLKKIVYGYESWWQKIETKEDSAKAITDEAIQNTWYIRLLQNMSNIEQS